MKFDVKKTRKIENSSKIGDFKNRIALYRLNFYFWHISNVFKVSAISNTEFLKFFEFQIENDILDIILGV